RPIRTNQRRYGEPACRSNDTVPLPTANQLIHPAGSAVAERLAISERQLIAEAGVELMEEAEGRGSLVEAPVKAIHGRRRLIVGATGKVRRIDVQHFPPGVIALERQPAACALQQREAHRVVTAGSDIVPTLAGAEQGVRARSHRNVLGSLRHDVPLIRRKDSTAETAPRIF